MKVPTSALPDRITVEPYEGTSGTGASVYGTAVTNVPARLEGRRRLVRTGVGADVMSNATAIIRPGQAIPEQSRVTVTRTNNCQLDGRTFTVGDVASAAGLRHPAYTELILVGH